MLINMEGGGGGHGGAGEEREPWSVRRAVSSLVGACSAPKSSPSGQSVGVKTVLPDSPRPWRQLGLLD